MLSSIFSFLLFFFRLSPGHLYPQMDEFKWGNELQSEAFLGLNTIGKLKNITAMYFSKQNKAVLRIRIRALGSSAFLTPGSGSGIQNVFFPDPGSQTHIFER
jgi:hypothetical protein